MAEFPALQLWTDAYLGDTTHLTTIEHGAYLLLLMAAWRSPDCRLPDDDKMLARYARLSPGQWARIKPIMLTFWEVKSSFWSQRRLTDEWVAVRHKRQQAADNGRLSALKRKGRHSTERIASDIAGVQPNANETATTTATATAIIPIDKSIGEIPVLADPVKVMFDTGKALLIAAGVKPANAGSLLGKWRKDHGDEALMSAIGKAKREGAIDPVAFIEGCFRAKRRDDAPAPFSLGMQVPC